MTIKKEDIEIRRSPKELLSFVEDTIEAIRKNEQEAQDAREKKKLHKEMWDEIFWLARITQHLYDENFEIKPILGNQGYDAEIWQGDNLIEKLEITCPIDGKREYEIGKALNKHGFVRAPPQPARIGTERFIETMQNKSVKDYENVILVMVYKRELTHLIRQHEGLKIAEELVEEAKKISFRAKYVYIFLEDFDDFPNGKIIKIEK